MSLSYCNRASSFQVVLLAVLYVLHFNAILFAEILLGSLPFW